MKYNFLKILPEGVGETIPVLPWAFPANAPIANVEKKPPGELTYITGLYKKEAE